jgi:hypothetical protein
LGVLTVYIAAVKIIVMKELFSFLWTSAPELTSVLFMIGLLLFIAAKATLFFAEFKQMGVRLTNVENRLDGLEKKVDQIIAYLLEDRASRQGK